MKIEINIEKKHLIIFSVFLVLLLSIFTYSETVNEYLPWHYVQQIAMGPADGGANKMNSIDSNKDGYVDIANNATYAFDADKLDGYNSSEFATIDYVDYKDTVLTPPNCTGESKALQWNGSYWKCVNVSSGENEEVTCPCGECWSTRCEKVTCPSQTNAKYYTLQCTPSGEIKTGEICLKCVYIPHSCFTKGTIVTMFDKSIKNIEDIKIGDKVLGKDNKINTVLKLERPTINGRKTYIINNKIEATGDHPFLTTNGWKVNDLNYKLKILKSPNYEPNDNNPVTKDNVGQLKIGDVIYTKDGTEIITNIEIKNDRPNEEIVYDLDVDGDDTYFANEYLVHNC